MAGKRCPPSPSREYTSLSTLMAGPPAPDTIEESLGDSVSNKACHIEEETVSPFF